LLHADLAGLQVLAGKYKEAVASYQQILARSREGRAHYNQLRSQQIYLRLGNALLSNGQIAEAHQAFAQVLARFDGGTEEITAAHLRMGQAADLMDDRDKALEHYQKVLAMPTFQDSQDQARKYLKKPYRL
jgi:tetratricopeptide (TPR) repeat protein